MRPVDALEVSCSCHRAFEMGSRESQALGEAGERWSGWPSGLLSWTEEDMQFQVALRLAGIVSNRVTQHLSLLAQRRASDREFIMNTINNEGDGYWPWENGSLHSLGSHSRVDTYLGACRIYPVPTSWSYSLGVTGSSQWWRWILQSLFVLAGYAEGKFLCYRLRGFQKRLAFEISCLN